MIAPQELRLGNYVMCGSLLTQVTVINKNNFIVTELDASEGEFNYSSCQSNITPIELTNELLLKFGFKKHEVTPFYYLEVCNDWTRIYFNPVHKVCELSISGHSAVLKHIEYVHQMQNLKFDVTGEELTIKEQP